MAEENSIYAIAAMCGNFWGESHVNPNCWESGIVRDWTSVWQQEGVAPDGSIYGSGGFGLGQWTNTGGDSHGRLYQMWKWVTEKGFQPTDGNGQLEYIFHEDYWIKDGVEHAPADHSGATSPKEFMTTTSHDLDGLTADWMACWEGIVNSSLSVRQDFAHKAFDFIRAHKDDAPGNFMWRSPNNWMISEEDALNNSMCVYLKLQGYDPGGDPDDPTKPDEDKKRRANRSFWLCIGHKRLI